MRAPRAGRIVEKHLMAGQQLVARGDQSLLTIADLSSLWLVTDLFEADARGVLRGFACHYHGADTAKQNHRR